MRIPFLSIFGRILNQNFANIIDERNHVRYNKNDVVFKTTLKSDENFIYVN